MPNPRLLCSFALLLAGAPVAAPGQTLPFSTTPAKITVDPAEMAQWIPFVRTGPESDHETIVISLTINGVRLDAVVDTGAANIVIDEGWAIAHGLTPQAGGTGQSASGGSFTVKRAAIDSLRIGGLTQTGGLVQVQDMAPLSRVAPTPFQAVIGSSFLAKVATEIDFDRGAIRFQPPTTPAPEGVAVPVTLTRNNRLLTRLSINGATVDPVVVDTGDDSYLSITRAAFAGVPHDNARVTNLMSADLTGLVVNDYLRLSGAALGGQALDPVPTLVVSRLSQADDRARIGLSVLRRYHVFLNPARGVLILSPRKTPPPKTAISTSGVQGEADDRGLAVAHVMRGSPAEEAGLKPGDRICSIDGEVVTAAWRTPPRSLWGRGPAGTRRTLTLCDGRTVAFVLREFY